jgi:hypothetical protein
MARRSYVAPPDMAGHAGQIWTTHQRYRRRGRVLRFRDLRLVEGAERATYDLRTHLKPREAVNSAALPTSAPTPESVAAARAAAGTVPSEHLLGPSVQVIDGRPRGLRAPSPGEVHGFPKLVCDRYRQDVVATTDLPRKAKKAARADADLLLARNLAGFEHLELARGDFGSPHAVLAIAALGV